MRYLRLVPFLAVLAVIVYAGLRPEPVPQMFNEQDKLHHLLGFAALTFTLRLTFVRPHLVWILLFSLTASLLIELGQELLPDRTASAADMLANAVGVFVGWLCTLPVRHWLQGRQR